MAVHVETPSSFFRKAWKGSCFVCQASADISPGQAEQLALSHPGFDTRFVRAIPLAKTYAWGQANTHKPYLEIRFL